MERVIPHAINQFGGALYVPNGKVAAFADLQRADVGAKAEIHTIMGELVKQGVAVIMISS